MTTSNRNTRARPPRPASRVRHYQGERLTSGDLAEDSAYESWLRALHVRAAHDTWGVALGFSLGVSSEALQVHIGPGLGYDACAREVLLSEAVTLDLPDGSDMEEFSFRPYDLVCFADSLQASAGLRLADAEHPVRLGVEIPLGTVWLYRWNFVTHALGPDLTIRRSARAAIRPHIEFARLDGGELEWSDYDQAGLVFDTTLKIEQSSFQSQPVYLVWLVDHPWQDRLPPWISVKDRQYDGFGLRLVFEAPIELTSLKKFTILWVGFEPIEGLWPELGPVSTTTDLSFTAALSALSVQSAAPISLRRRDER